MDGLVHPLFLLFHRANDESKGKQQQGAASHHGDEDSSQVYSSQGKWHLEEQVQLLATHGAAVGKVGPEAAMVGAWLGQHLFQAEDLPALNNCSWGIMNARPI